MITTNAFYTAVFGTATVEKDADGNIPTSTDTNSPDYKWVGIILPLKTTPVERPSVMRLVLFTVFSVTIVDIRLDRMALVNMSNKFYYYRRVTPGGIS
mgnify:CR=1 FL=1